MSLVAVKALSELLPGRIAEARAQDCKYVICNVGGELHCLTGVCPHAGGPLAQGSLEGHQLICPWHGWQFDCRTGLSAPGKAVKLNVFPVTVKDGMIVIEVP